MNPNEEVETRHALERHRRKTIQHLTSFMVAPFGLVRLKWLESYPRLREASTDFEYWLNERAARVDDFIDRHQRVIYPVIAVGMIAGVAFMLWALNYCFNHR